MRKKKVWCHSCVSCVIRVPDYQHTVKGWRKEKRVRRKIGRQKGKRGKNEVCTGLLLESGSEIVGKQGVMAGHCKGEKDEEEREK